MVKRFVASGRSGFYVSIVQEGDVGGGDRIDIADRAIDSVSVADIFSIMMGEHADRGVLHRAASLDALSPSWRDRFRSLLA
jgi:MOSC domain-containing protein YiiM